MKKATRAADLVIVCLGTGIVFYSKITVSMVNVGVVYFHSFHPFEFSIYPDRFSHWVWLAGFERFEMLQYEVDLIRIDIFGGHLRSTVFDF